MEAQAGCVLRLEPAAQLAEDAALADARLAGQQHHLAFAVLRQVPALDQEAEFMLAADEIGQPAAPHRFEAALGGRHPLDRPGLDRLGKTLDRVPAKCAQAEHIAEQPAGRCWDDDRPRLGQRLQSRRQVRRLADHRLLLCGTFADEIADHHEAGGDADAHLELAASGRVEPSDIGDDVEAGAHRPLGIVFVGLRIAEVNQHAVAHVFGDETVEAAHCLGDRPVIGADHLAQLFEVEPRRQRRRADQVAEHHRQLPALRAIDASGGRSGYRQGDRLAATAAELAPTVRSQSRNSRTASAVRHRSGRKSDWSPRFRPCSSGSAFGAPTSATT